jgi:hypothetical protein
MKEEKRMLVTFVKINKEKNKISYCLTEIPCQRAKEPKNRLKKRKGNEFLVKFVKNKKITKKSNQVYLIQWKRRRDFYLQYNASKEIQKKSKKPDVNERYINENMKEYTLPFPFLTEFQRVFWPSKKNTSPKTVFHKATLINRLIFIMDAR